MEENDPIDPDYLKGFNEGYTIGKHMPDISNQIKASLGNSLRCIGFQDGMDHVILEQKKDQVILDEKKDHLPNWLKRDRLSSLDKPAEPSNEKDRDDPDKEL